MLLKSLSAKQAKVLPYRDFETYVKIRLYLSSHILDCNPTPAMYNLPNGSKLCNDIDIQIINEYLNVAKLFVLHTYPVLNLVFLHCCR